MQLVTAVVITALMLAGGAVLLNRVPVRTAPGVWRRLQQYLTTNSVETDASSVFPELRTRHYAETPERLFSLLRAAIVALEWELTNEIPTQFEARATITTPMLRFKDDLRVRVQPEAGERSCLLVSSRSRVGRGDFGANVRHLLDLYAHMRVLGATQVNTP